MAEYIDRKSIEYPYMTMSMWGLNSNTCKAYNEGVKAVEDYIANLPATDVVEVKHGEWIEKEIPLNWCEDDVEISYECSICDSPVFDEYPYCPSCGAKMDGETK